MKRRLPAGRGAEGPRAGKVSHPRSCRSAWAWLPAYAWTTVSPHLITHATQAGSPRTPARFTRGSRQRIPSAGVRRGRCRRSRPARSCRPPRARRPKAPARCESPALFKPKEREVIELSIRHGLSDAELAVVLGMSCDEANALASRARATWKGPLRAAHHARRCCRARRHRIDQG
jgi:hypothetical protein